jgi:DNA recombination protein RmuC
MDYIALLIGLAIGGFVGFLIAQRKKSETPVDILQEPLVQQLKESEQLLKHELNTERQKREELLTKNSTLQQLNASLEERQAHQKTELEELRQKFTAEFQNLANRIFEEKSTTFSKQNKDQIELLLRPFRDNLKEFETKVDKVYKDENTERISLKTEIKMLVELNKQISTEANNLATALKGDNKTQGNWGELVLETVLEHSGLREGSEYTLQFTTQNVQGETIRPDVVVQLPEGKHIVIDSKVSMNAYAAMVGAENEEDKKRFSKAHVDSVKSHIKLLSEKSYQSSGELITPALHADPEMYIYAMDKKIVLVSPTTLLATLRTVSSIWKQEQRNRNAEQIATEAGKMYDKLAAFVSDMEALGAQLERTSKTYAETMKKLSAGTGNLITRAEKLRKMGLKTTKEISKNLTENSDETDDL